MKGPWKTYQASPGEICAHRIVPSTLFFHLYHGAPEANAATQTSASKTSAAIFDFIKCLPSRANRPKTKFAAFGYNVKIVDLGGRLYENLNIVSAILSGDGGSFEIDEEIPVHA
jgi:hypothetical protein